MSYSDGIAALNLEMPDRVPRTEYSAEFHWDLISKVLGVNVSEQSCDEEKWKASSDFIKAWNYDLRWCTLVDSSFLTGPKTKMGHANYRDEGTDFVDNRVWPFDEPEDVLKFDPMSTYGEISIQDMIKKFEEQYQNNVKSCPDCVNMTGIYISCISGLIEMFGWEMLLYAAGTDPKAFGELTNRYTDWISQHFLALANSNVPVVMIHDDIVWTEGPFLHPDWYRKYVFPNYKKMFAPLIESGKKILFTSDGTYTEFIDDIAGCGIHGFVMEPTTDMRYIAEKYGKTHAFVGNADTRILLSGTKADIYNEVKRCMDIGKNCPGFFMAVGNHIPPNTPVENALYYNEVYEELSKR
ncbi:MAG: uroporphyrinogen decarboxylase family protein [Eubacteriales bacterium]